jgi:DNA-directed RNA polymerase alpha subunit
MPDLSLLEKPIDQLEISPELALFMLHSGFSTLNQMLRYRVSELLKMEGFGYRLLKELYKLLAANGCDRMLNQ